VAGLPLTQEVPAFGKLHVLTVPDKALHDFGNGRPIAANMRTREAPWGQCLNHDIDPKTDTHEPAKAFDPRGNHMNRKHALRIVV